MAAPTFTHYRSLQTVEEIRNENVTLKAENEKLKNQLLWHQIAAVTSAIALTVFLGAFCVFRVCT